MKLVLLPGMDGTGDLLTPFVKELDERGIASQVISYPTDVVLGYEELIERVSSALPEDDELVLLGESFSGPIALALAQRDTPGLRGLVLVVTFAEAPDSMLLQLTRVLPVKWILSQPVPCWMAHKLMLGEVRPKTNQEALCRVIKNISPEVIAERLRAVRELKLSPQPTDLPSLYIQGTRDSLLPESALESVERLVPRLRVERVEGPHLVLDIEPGRCAELVSEFISSLSAEIHR